MKKCPFCKEEIQSEALKCKHCGEYLDGKLRNQVDRVDVDAAWSRGYALALAVALPGAGQIYRGELLAGVLWMSFVVMFYLFFWPLGVVLHIMSIFGAVTGPSRL